MTYRLDPSSFDATANCHTSKCARDAGGSEKLESDSNFSNQFDMVRVSSTTQLAIVPWVAPATARRLRHPRRPGTLPVPRHSWRKFQSRKNRQTLVRSHLPSCDQYLRAQR